MKKPLRSPLLLLVALWSACVVVTRARFGPGDVPRLDDVAPGNRHIGVVAGAPADSMVVR